MSLLETRQGTYRREADDLQKEAIAVGRLHVVHSILKVVCDATHMGFATVARVTEDRWLACQVLDRVEYGLKPGGEVPIETTLCDEVRRFTNAIVIDNVPDDPEYATHHTPRLYGLQSYISVPIVLADGSFFGTLCAVDSKPNHLKNTYIVGMFELFAQLIADHIDEQRTLEETREHLRQTRELGRLREEFVAVLGHDLRNPLAVIESGHRRLLRQDQTEKSREILRSLQGTTRRMAALIGNVLDLARIRLGEGLTVDLKPLPLGPVIEQLVGEIRTAYPTREIDLRLEPDLACAIDAVRFGQLLSNLLVNALVHGSEFAPIRVRAGRRAEGIELSVANGGEPIPDAALGRLFQPFYRGARARNSQGLGLGLYIVSEIAKAHGASLEATSDLMETKFTLRLPA